MNAFIIGMPNNAIENRLFQRASEISTPEVQQTATTFFLAAVAHRDLVIPATDIREALTNDSQELIKKGLIERSADKWILTEKFVLMTRMELMRVHPENNWTAMETKEDEYFSFGEFNICTRKAKLLLGSR